MMILFVATRNAHKTQEIRDILADTDARVFTMADLPAVPAVIEDGKTFKANALKKAHSLSRWITTNPRLLLPELTKGQAPLFALADDSGLEVDALDGAPGVYSARFAAQDTGIPGNSPDVANNQKLLNLLTEIPTERRGARFRCVLALAPVAGEDRLRQATFSVNDYLERNTMTFEGVCEGTIAKAPSGLRGFGYDPLFIPTGYHESFADLKEQVKNKISHRAQALEKLKKHFKALKR